MKKIENYLLGMDCGTTNIKAVILGEDGVVVCEASRPNQFINPGPGMQEQDARKWWSNAVEIFRQITDEAGTDIVKRIRGISISSHTVSLLPLDVNGEPLRNAITYQDGRSSAQLDEIVEKLEKTDAVLQCSSFINYKLTGVLSSDVDQASRTQCMDRTTLQWSHEFGDAMGIDLDSILPPPRPVDDIIGFVSSEAAEETGLLAGTPVIAGCSDAMASMYATGMSRLGEAGEASGTTSLVFVGSTEPSAPDVPVVTRPCGIEGVPWIFDAPIQASGASLKWFIDTMAAEEKLTAEAEGKNIYEYLNELALQAPAGCRGLFYFPYLLGERAPIWNNYAKGMFIGLGMDTSRAELTRSIFEGTAFALRHVMETIKESGGSARTLRVCGGGAKSRTWNQIKASMLKMPVYILADDSGDVPVGDCMIVGRKVGVFSSFEEASNRAIRVKEIVQPVDEWVKAYDKLYPYYVKFYQDLDKDLCALKQTLEG